jgi:hypothetical protein
LVIILWLAAAIAFGASGVPQGLKPPAPQVLLLGLSGLSLLAIFLLPRLRAWADALDVRWLVALHLTRFIGFYFLLLYNRGEMPKAFAVTAGWGDNLVATLAVLLLVSGAPMRKGRWLLYLIWNVIGLVDILFVVVTAARIGITDPASMHALLTLPLNLLPTWLVPLIIVSHIVLFVRLVRMRKGVNTRAYAA